MSELTAPSTWQKRSPSNQVRGDVVLLLAALMGLSFCVDLSVARLVHHGRSPRIVSELLENAEPFGNGYGAAFVVLSVLSLDVVKRRAWPWLLAGSLGAGALASGAKLVVTRFRPRTFESFPVSVASTFGDWFPPGRNGDLQSFPSAHTATAVGLAVILARLYPRGRFFFFAMAILVGLQRINVSAHYPSDVFAGAIIGYIISGRCLTFLPADWKEQQAADSSDRRQAA